MLEILVLLAIVFQYVVFIYSIVNKKSGIFCFAYIFSIFFYDYLFINASYFLPSILLNLLKPLNEYIFIYFIFITLTKISITKRLGYSQIDKLIVWLILLPCLIVFLVEDLLGEIDLMNSTLGFRSYILPIIIPYLFYKRGFLHNLNIYKLFNLLFFLSAISVIYAFIQREDFNGNLSQLWFAEFFSKFKVDPVLTAPYDFIRNDLLRAPSFFVSPIIYSIGLSMSTVIAFNLLLYKNVVYGRFFLFTMLLFFLFGLFLAETRVGLFIAMLGFAISSVTFFLRSTISYKILILIPIIAISLTFISLIFGYTEDLSALGRLEQYINFGSIFKVFGLGLKTNVVFDSFYLSIITVFGALGLLVFGFYLKFNKVIFDIFKKSLSETDVFFVASVLAISSTFVYSFAFQLTAGSYSYKLLFFLMFLVVSRYEKKKR